MSHQLNKKELCTHQVVKSEMKEVLSSLSWGIHSITGGRPLETGQHLTKVWFQKNYPGISRGLSVKKSGDLSFLRKCYYNFFYFLHEANTVQYLAAVSLSGSTSRLLN